MNKKQNLSLREAVEQIKKRNLDEGIMGSVNVLFDKAKSVLANVVPGGNIIKQMSDAGMSDNETVAFFQNVLGPMGYVAGAIPALIQKAKVGDPMAQKTLATSAQKAFQLHQSRQQQVGQQRQLQGNV